MEKSDKISRRLRRQRRKKIEGAEAGLRKAKTGHRINEKKKKKSSFSVSFEKRRSGFSRGGRLKWELIAQTMEQPKCCYRKTFVRCI